MRCVFSTQFKQLIKDLSIVTVFISSLVLIAFLSMAGLGYVSIHWFDFINFVDAYTNGPIDYYIRQGFYVGVLLALSILALITVYGIILHPIYYLIRFPKRVLNYIFDCKEPNELHNSSTYY